MVERMREENLTGSLGERLFVLNYGYTVDRLISFSCRVSS